MSKAKMIGMSICALVCVGIALVIGDAPVFPIAREKAPEYRLDVRRNEGITDGKIDTITRESIIYKNSRVQKVLAGEPIHRPIQSKGKVEEATKTLQACGTTERMQGDDVFPPLGAAGPTVAHQGPAGGDWFAMNYQYGQRRAAIMLFLGLLRNSGSVGPGKATADQE